MAPIKIVSSQLTRGQTTICLLLKSRQYLNITFWKGSLLHLRQAWSNALGWTTLLSWGPLARKWWETPASPLDALSSPRVLSWAQWQWQSWLQRPEWQPQAGGTPGTAGLELQQLIRGSIWCWELSKVSTPLKCLWVTGERLDLSTRVLLLRSKTASLPSLLLHSVHDRRRQTGWLQHSTTGWFLAADVQGDAHILLHGQHSHGPNWHSHQRYVRAWVPFQDLWLQLPMSLYLSPFWHKSTLQKEMLL